MTTAFHISGCWSHLHANKQAAVRPTRNAKVPGRCDLAINEILPNREEVVIDALPMRFETSFVPRRAKLTPATNVGYRENAAAFQPELTVTAE